VRVRAANGADDIVVRLASGTYRTVQPLVFSPVLLHSRDRYSDWLLTSIRLAEQAGVSDLESLFCRAAERSYGLG
jgi:hypothetical protein